MVPLLGVGNVNIFEPNREARVEDASDSEGMFLLHIRQERRPSLDYTTARPIGEEEVSRHAISL